jgi:chemotaxis protein CheD
MYRHYNLKFKKDTEVIGPGERYATAEDIIISTVLGSCVAVALIDFHAGISGLNHYMLPGNDLKSFFLGEEGKYGIHAMDLLLSDMERLGATGERMEAKIFGGGAVLRLRGKAASSVPDTNIDFAYSILEKKYGFPITASDVGGTHARKLLFFTKTGKVLVKRLTGTMVTPVAVEEENLLIKELDE